jgi:hypothetical protein
MNAIPLSKWIGLDLAQVERFHRGFIREILFVYDLNEYVFPPYTGRDTLEVWYEYSTRPLRAREQAPLGFGVIIAL